MHIYLEKGGQFFGNESRRQITSLSYFFQDLKKKKALFREDARQDCCVAVTVNNSINETM